MNNNGHRIDPCGTPLRTCNYLDTLPFSTLSNYCLLRLELGLAIGLSLGSWLLLGYLHYIPPCG